MRRRSLLAALLVLAVGAALGASAARSNAAALGASADSVFAIPDSLRGRSGQLRATVVLPPSDSAYDAEFRLPPVWSIADTATKSQFHFISILPFSQKQDGRVGAYRVGRWPSERRSSVSAAYRSPLGFIELTPDMLGMAVSTHFTLGDFLVARSQQNVWPKPLVLDFRLVDKLELILKALADSGIAKPRLKIMSAFRTPSVTMNGARTAQAPDSRHQYGDAADIVVDANGDGRMDDLNRDRRVDLADARYLVRIILAVEAAHPELVGGIGLYRGSGLAGPFVHTDTRGERVRWGLQ